MTTVHDFQVTSLEGRDHTLDEHAGKVLLIVNTASKCGLTPQFEGLEALYQQFKGDGFEILGFPCNQFAGQEPGGEDQIGAFCQRNYGVSFPMHAKIEVNGAGTHPLYKFLKAEKRGLLGTEAIKWNFTKFLVDRKGRVVKRYAPKDSPSSIASDVARLVRESS